MEHRTNAVGSQPRSRRTFLRSCRALRLPARKALRVNFGWRPKSRHPFEGSRETEPGLRSAGSLGFARDERFWMWRLVLVLAGPSPFFRLARPNPPCARAQTGEGWRLPP